MFRKLFKSRLFRIVFLAVLGYSGFVCLVAIIQRSLIYYPATMEESRVEKTADRLGWSKWRDDRGRYAGWRTEELPGEGILIVFHGNAGHALARRYWVRHFADLGQSGFEAVHIFEYPGYGIRKGSPGEKRFLDAARSAVDALFKEVDPATEVFLLGESLGGGIATRIAADYPQRVSGVILTTPFPDLKSVGNFHYPFLPVGLLLWDRYDNEENLRGFAGPVAFVLAGRDGIVPPELGRRLAENYGGEGRIWEVGEARHNTLIQSTGRKRWLRILEFLR